MISESHPKGPHRHRKPKSFLSCLGSLLPVSPAPDTQGPCGPMKACEAAVLEPACTRQPRKGSRSPSPGRGLPRPPGWRPVSLKIECLPFFTPLSKNLSQQEAVTVLSVSPLLQAYIQEKCFLSLRLKCKQTHTHRPSTPETWR